jgi:hypothetical protein
MREADALRRPDHVDARDVVHREVRTPVLALSVEQACEALNVSWKTWREHIEPDLKVIRIGRCKRYAVSELERWCAERGELVGV